MHAGVAARRAMWPPAACRWRSFRTYERQPDEGDLGPVRGPGGIADDLEQWGLAVAWHEVGAVRVDDEQQQDGVEAREHEETHGGHEAWAIAEHGRVGEKLGVACKLGGDRYRCDDPSHRCRLHACMSRRRRMCQLLLASTLRLLGVAHRCKENR